MLPWKAEVSLYGRILPYYTCSQIQTKLGECMAPDITRQDKMKKGKQMSTELLLVGTRKEINLKVI